MNEINVTTQALEEAGQATKGINWGSLGKKGGAVLGGAAILYLGVKYVAKPLARKFFKGDEEYTEVESDSNDYDIDEVDSEE